MPLKPNDVIPLGVGPSVLTFLATDNGLGFFPPGRVIRGKGNGNYWNVEITIHSTTNIAAVALLGASATDIKRALEM